MVTNPWISLLRYLCTGIVIGTRKQKKWSLPSLLILPENGSPGRNSSTWRSGKAGVDPIYPLFLGGQISVLMPKHSKVFNKQLLNG